MNGNKGINNKRRKYGTARIKTAMVTINKELKYNRSIQRCQNTVSKAYVRVGTKVSKINANYFKFSKIIRR